MANMSYCRFHNTALDLHDCIDALEERTVASEDERDKAYELLRTFLDFAEDNGIIEEYDEDSLNNVIDDLEINE